MMIATNGHGPDHLTVSQRSLPCDINAERATLGAILLDRDAILVVAEIVGPDDFYLEKHVLIYTAMVALIQQVPPVPPDLSLVADALRRCDQLHLVGGLAYLAELSAEVPTAAHADYYASIVKRAATRRRIIECGGKISALGYDEREALPVTLNQVEALVFDITQQDHQASDFTLAADAVAEFYEEMTTRPPRIVPTGLLDLDRILGAGLKAGQLVVLAARPSMGKSALALTILHNMAVKSQYRVGCISLEMSKPELMTRLVAYETGLNTQRIDALWAGIRSAGEPAPDDDDVEGDKQKIFDALGVLSNGSYALEDHSTARYVAAVRSKARRLAMQWDGIDLLIIDYLQLMEASEGVYKEHNRVQEITFITRQLKMLAGELRCPILLLSQLNRRVEERTSKIPVLSDLRESGSTEQDADIVAFINREEKYDPDTDRKGQADIIIAKHRNGPTTAVVLGFDDETTHFRNFTKVRHLDGY